MHLFHDERVADVDDASPKHHGYVPSQTHFRVRSAREPVRGSMTARSQVSDAHDGRLRVPRDAGAGIRAATVDPPAQHA